MLFCCFSRRFKLFGARCRERHFGCLSRETEVTRENPTIMMFVADRAKYNEHREARREGGGGAARREFWSALLLFGSLGGVTWAIRGTDGWGGIDGTVVPGLSWGMLWYYLCHRKGIDARGIPLWLGLGIALGGDLGYGQFISWIQGRFNVGETIVPVSHWFGYTWLALTGIGWGAPGSIALGWALSRKASPSVWLIRILVPTCIGYLGWLLVQACPWLFFPNYGQDIYTGELGKHLSRTVYTNTQNFTVVAWWIGAMLVAAFQKDRITLVVGALIGGGFGIGFAQSALWCLGYTYAPGFIDWWKVWELNAGFNLGVLYTIALYWAVRQMDKKHDPDGFPLTSPGIPARVSHRLQRVSLSIGLFLLLYITFRGATSTMGGLLGLYDVNVTNQYDWPLARTVLFTPMAIIIAGVTVWNLWRDLRTPEPASQTDAEPPRLPERMADLVTGIGVIGAITIWPSKIAALYALFIFCAIFALNRLNRRLDRIDTTERRAD